MIRVQNITFSHAGEVLYEKASFAVPKNKKAGLVGLNGSGKSTLFSLLRGEEYPEDGKIWVEGTIRLVPQEVSQDEFQQKAVTVREYLFSARKNSDHVMQKLLRNMELGGLSLDNLPRELSGGQKTKLAILHAVLSEPDVLLLDEPTNFLDLAGKRWVMNWLSQYKKTLMIVSHDLDLLDQSIDKVIYINKQTHQIEEYTGTYTKFKKLKRDRDDHLTRFIRNQEQKIARMQKSVEKLRRSNVEKVIHQRVALEKRIQKIQDSLPQVPREIVKIKLTLPTPAPIGELPIRVVNLHKNYGNKAVLKDVSFSVQRGERMALVGQNGVGKSTLIKILMNLVVPDDGWVDIDARALTGYYSQELESFDLKLTLFDTLRRYTDADDRQIRTFLAKFMFTKEKFRQTVGSLSGGEKTRLSMALLMLKNHNLLILDEPTTYLDVMSQRLILEALKEYRGTMIVVSHTPDFLEELKLDKVLILPEEKVVYWSEELLKRSSLM